MEKHNIPPYEDINSNMFRVAFIGDSGSGKTRLTRLICDESYNASRDLRTNIVDLKLVKIDENNTWSVQTNHFVSYYTENNTSARFLRLFDIGCEAKYYSLCKSLLRRLSVLCAVIVIDGRLPSAEMHKRYEFWTCFLPEGCVPVVVFTHRSKVDFPDIRNVKLLSIEFNELQEEFLESKRIELQECIRNSLNSLILSIPKNTIETLRDFYNWLNDDEQGGTECTQWSLDLKSLQDTMKLPSESLFRLSYIPSGKNKVKSITKDQCKTLSPFVVTITSSRNQSRNHWFAISDDWYINLIRFVDNPQRALREAMDILIHSRTKLEKSVSKKSELEKLESKLSALKCIRGVLSRADKKRHEYRHYNDVLTKAYKSYLKILGVELIGPAEDIINELVCDAAFLLSPVIKEKSAKLDYFQEVLLPEANQEVLLPEANQEVVPRQTKSGQDLLDEAVASKNLCELHTHLLGMGSDGFWVERVMTSLIPKIVARENGDFNSRLLNVALRHESISILNEVNVFDQLYDRNFFSNICPDNFEKEEIRFFVYNLLTVDVVYSVDEIRKAMFDDLLIDEGGGVDKIRRIEKMLSNADVRSRFDDNYKEHLVYNAKKGRCEVVTGLTNQYLLQMMEWNERSTLRSAKANSIIARIRNCFAMLNPDGSVATEADLDAFRGNFTPCFYPMRYALKDPLYQQYPIVLSYLLNNSCQRYLRSGVSYVEFSVGISDLTQERIFSHIHPDMALRGLDIDGNRHPHIAYCLGFEDFPRDTKFNYKCLMAFPRNLWDVNEGQYLPAYLKRKFVILTGTLYIENLTNEERTSTFLATLFGREQIAKWIFALNAVFNLDDKYRKENFYPLIVGADIVGDEDGHPFSPFLHKDILHGLKKFHEGNAKFGIRLHAGENVAKCCSVQDDFFYDELQLNFHTHMNVISAEILLLKDTFFHIENSKKIFNIRIGHGLAFSTNMQTTYIYNNLTPEKLCTEFCENARSDGLKTLLQDLVQCNFSNSTLSITGQKFKDCKEFLVREEICFEINLTSNNTLLSDVYWMEIGSAHGRRLLLHMLASNFFLLLSTDDDGIWPIRKCTRHNYHISVAHEYCRSIRMLEHIDDRALRDCCRSGEQATEIEERPTKRIREDFLELLGKPLRCSAKSKRFF